MGRHSAPDEVGDDSAVDDAASTVPGTATAVDVASLRGRHSRSDEEPDESALDQAHTQRIAVIEDAPTPPMVDEAPTDVFVPWAAPAAEPEAVPAEPDEKQKKQKPAKEPKRPKALKEPKKQKPDKAAAKAADKAAKQAAKAERKKSKPAKAKRESDTRADLRLLRENSAVRAQAIGAVVASFLIYTVVMLVIGRTAAYLLWLWAPIVVSGVLVGVVLDLAHRRLTKRAGNTD